MDRTTDFGSVGEGSNPSAVTNNQSITLLKIFLGAFFFKKWSFRGKLSLEFKKFTHKRSRIMNDFSKKIIFLKEQGAPIEEVRLVEILEKEEEWNLLSNVEKQKKRKSAISFLERESENNVINIELEKNIVDLYDIGEKIISDTMCTNKKYLNWLNILINIQQKFIDEVRINNLCKIRKLDIDILKNLFKEIELRDCSEYYNLNLNNYLFLFDKIWKKWNIIR